MELPFNLFNFYWCLWGQSFNVYAGLNVQDEFKSIMVKMNVLRYKKKNNLEAEQLMD